MCPLMKADMQMKETIEKKRFLAEYFKSSQEERLNDLTKEGIQY